MLDALGKSFLERFRSHASPPKGSLQWQSPCATGTEVLSLTVMHDQGNVLGGSDANEKL
jgi:hypothetical protein